MAITSIRDTDEPCFQEIVSRIYLGSCEAYTKDTIIEKKITHILSLGDFSNDLNLQVEYKVKMQWVLDKKTQPYTDCTIEYQCNGC
jgi:hypothetical protein